MSTVAINNGQSLNIFGGKATIARGSRPSSILIYANPVTSGIALKGGDIAFDSVTFTNCKPVKSWFTEDNQPDSHGQHVFTFHDRRAHWKNVIHRVRYNQRANDNTLLETTKANLQEIADDMLSLLGEGSTDTSGLPTNVYPLVDFHGPVADGLWDALRRCGCDMALNTDDSISCFRLGTGTIPTTTTTITQPNSVRTEIPTTVRLVCGPTWWESLFELQAVGLETDGSIVAIDSLSYKPSSGWGSQWPQFFSGVDPQYRHLAFMSVFKWYRVVQLAQGGLQPEGCSEAVARIEQLLPLRASLVEPAANYPQKYWNQEAEVHGVSWQFTADPENLSECVRHASMFTLDEENGIVKFVNPVFKLDTNGCPTEADMNLLCAHRVRLTTGDYIRKTYDTTVGTGTATDPFVVYFPELFETHRQVYTGTTCGSQTPSLVSNTTALEAEAAAVNSPWATAVATPTYFSRAEFASISSQQCSGVVSQVEYRTGNNRRPATIIGIGQEHDIYQLSDMQRQLSSSTELLLDSSRK